MGSPASHEGLIRTGPAEGYAAVAALMREQGTPRRLRSDHVDDAAVLELLELAGHASAGSRYRVEWVVVRDPEIKHQLARTNRQAWSVYKRLLRRRSSPDAVLETRQWLADHLEDVPVLVVACVPGRRPLLPALGGAAFFGCVFLSVQNLLLAAAAAGLAATSTTLPLWSRWQARRTLGLPARVTPVVLVPLGHPVGSTAPTPARPVANVAHLDRWGHRPFRAGATA